MKINQIHKHYGKCVAMYCIQGEPYRFFQDKDGGIAMIPLDCIDEEDILK